MPLHEQNGETSNDEKNAYATLLTRPSYLAGALLLSYTLHKHTPKTPLIILYTPETLPEPCIQALESEAKYSNIILHAIEHLRLPTQTQAQKPSQGTGIVAERFVDTWTKLRVFQLCTSSSLSPSLSASTTQNEQNKNQPPTLHFDKICFLDADMMVFQNPSASIFTPALPANTLLATHVCVCNLDNDPWAPVSWCKENCAYTPLSTSSSSPPPVSSNPPTHGIMNTGAFVFRPSSAIAKLVLSTFTKTDVETLRAMKFPDQDFLNLCFEGRWRALDWRVNALKTWRYWHPGFWRDEEVQVCHYIVDKPWAKRVRREGDGIEERLVAGYMGLDGVTHSWWWGEYERWRWERRGEGEEGFLEVVGRYVAGEDGEGDDEALRAVGGGAQDFAKGWEGKGESVNVDERVKRVLGERGHGSVVSNRRVGFEASSHQPEIES